MRKPAMEQNHLDALLTEMRQLAPEFPPRLVSHAETRTAEEKQAILAPGVWVQKSLSLLLGTQLFFVSGLGDFRLARWQVRAIGRHFALSALQTRSQVINPFWLSAERTSGLAEGMVSPFFPPNFLPTFSAVILLPAPDLRPTDQVAISTSLASSALFPAGKLADLIRAYGLQYYPQIPLVSLSPPAVSLVPPPKAARRTNMMIGA